ncbi:hypothetical protein AEYBE204_18975 [Asticcacaulis sp. YBE204]|nr:hypothetical protein AEYBE204_18975 [Asticcacaulis sp. YBE204]
MRARLSQDQAAKAVGTSQPTWGRYESGDSLAFYERLSVRRKVLDGLGFTEQQLEAEVALLSHDGAFPGGDAPKTSEGVSETGGEIKASVAQWITPNSRFMRIPTDDMAPYVYAGEVVLYDVARLPRRHGGVVIKMRGGAAFTRRFVRQGSGFVEVLRYEACDIDGQPAYVEIIEKLAAQDVEGLYPILLRSAQTENE